MKQCQCQPEGLPWFVRKTTRTACATFANLSRFSENERMHPAGNGIGTAQTSRATMHLTRTRTFLLIALTTILAYANSLRNDFVWDDEVLVKSNDYIRNFTYVTAAFVTDLSRTGHSSATYYRPLQTISYMFDYRFWGLIPAGYHLTNLLLHLTCALLLWLFVENITNRRPLALLVALLFAVHPVNTSAVTYVAGRADMLAFSGILGSFLCFLAYQNRANFRRGYYTAAIICFIGALFSRESAMLLPFLLTLYGLMLGRQANQSHRQALLPVIPFFLVLVCFAGWRTAVLNIHHQPLLAHWGIPFAERMQIVCRALATYLGLLLWPAHLQMDRQLMQGGAWLHFLTVAGIFIAIGFICLLRRAQPLVRFGLAWFILTILPVSGLLNLTASAAEHWLYVPAVGLYLAVAVGVGQLRIRPRILVPVSTMAIVAFGIRTAVRNQDWATGATIYTATAKAAPHSLRVRNNLGLTFTEEGHYRRALTELRAAERANPADATIKANLAVAYQLRGDLNQAARKDAECLKLDPQNVGTLLRIAYLYELRGNFKRARDHFMAALAVSQDIQPRLLFAHFLLRHRHYKEALEVVQNAGEIDPGNGAVFHTLGDVLVAGHQYRLAAEAFQMASALDPHAGEAEIIFDQPGPPVRLLASAR